MCVSALQTMRYLCCFALLVGCVKVDSDHVTDGGGDAPAASLARGPRGLVVGGDGFLPNAAIDINGTLIAVGSRKFATPTDDDTVIVRASGDGVTAQIAGTATEGDQLYAVAASGPSIFAVGKTGESALVLASQATSTALPMRRLAITGGPPLHAGTVAASGARWLIAGDHARGGFVAVTDSAGAPLQAATFSFELAGNVVVRGDIVVRRVVADATSIYVAGYMLGDDRLGFAAAFNATDLAARWAVQFAGASDVQAMDAAIDGATLTVVGQIGVDGFAAELDVETGAAQSLAYPGAQLVSVLRDDTRLWVAGRSAHGAFAGTLDGTDLHAIMLRDFVLPSLSPQSLVARTVGVSVIGTRATGMIEIPLRSAPSDGCADTNVAPAVIGKTGTAPTITAIEVETEPLPLGFDAPSTTIKTEKATTWDACTP